jgi:DNA-binding XRE family transcriptional regulator
MTLGQKITALRKARGMTQEELSEMVGVTRQTISKWELDTSTPDLQYLCKLCDLFGVTADYLIRPERETVEAANPATSDTPPTPSPIPAPQPPVKKPPNTRPAGWVLLGIAGILLTVGLISFLTDNPLPDLFIPAIFPALFALELLLIRRKPLFIVMWTAWILWTCIQFVLNGGVFIFFTLALNWATVFMLLWIAYTGFCIGTTVGLICKHIRSKRADP